MTSLYYALMILTPVICIINDAIIKQEPSLAHVHFQSVNWNSGLVYNHH